MPSQHRLKPRSFRPAPDEYAAAQADLASRGQQMDAFLRACLRWLHRDPDEALGVLAPMWPDPKAHGRPRHESTGPPLRPSGTATISDHDPDAGTEPANGR